MARPNTKRDQPDLDLPPYYTAGDAPAGDYFLGISIGSNQFFSKDRIKEIRHLLGTKCTSLLLVVADSLQRWNYVGLYDMPPEEASAKAYRVGQQYLKGYATLCQHDPVFSVTTASALQHYSRLHQITCILYNEYDKRGPFLRDVNRHSFDQLSLAASRQPYGPEPHPTAYYYIEELALSVFLMAGTTSTGRGQISPEEDPVLRRLYAGAYPELLAVLPELETRPVYVRIDPTDLRTDNSRS